MQFQVADQDKTGTLSPKEFLQIIHFIKKEAPKNAQAKINLQVEEQKYVCEGVRVCFVHMTSSAICLQILFT